MANIPEFPGVDQVVGVFGHWPSFHDAEIKWLRLDRHDLNGGTGPVLEFVIHCFEATNEIAPSGCYVLRKHTLVHFRFRDVTALRLADFNHQNVIFGLDIGNGPDDPIKGNSPFRITIDGSFGLEGSFDAAFSEVVSAVPCDERGETSQD